MAASRSRTGTRISTAGPGDRGPQLGGARGRRANPLGVLVAVILAGCTSTDAAPIESGDSRQAGCSALSGETVRWIIPYTPGGGYDIYSRLLEPHYERALGAEIVVENRTGGGGRVAARLVRDAAPNGRTLGLMNGTSLTVQDLLGEAEGLHPLDDFTLIGRISSQVPVLFTADEGPYPTVERLMTGAPDGPLVHGIVGIGSTSWILYVVASELLALDITYVTGYPGTRESSLGMIRGEFDVAGYTFDSMRDRTGPGGIRPIATLSAASRDAEPTLRDVPVVEGPDGLAVRRARETGRDPERAARLAAAIATVFETGRIVVAPPGLDPGLAACLRDRLATVVGDSAFLADAARLRRSITFLDADALQARVDATAPDREAVRAVFRRHVLESRKVPAGG